MEIITRAQWGAGPKRGSDVSSKLPWGEVVIHTEAGPQRSPASLGTEMGWIRAIEAFHVGPERGWDGIAYSFLIAPSGRIFEGRGWGRSGAHTEGRNSTAAGICFLGHGDKWPATDAQWSSTRGLIGEGVRLGKLQRRPKISGHKDYSQKGKTCPGTLIYPLLQAKLAGIDGPTGPVAPTGPSIGDDDMSQAQYDELHRLILETRGEAAAARGEAAAAGLRAAHCEQLLAEVQAQGKQYYGSLRGWAVAIANKLGVDRADAVANDPTSKP